VYLQNQFVFETTKSRRMPLRIVRFLIARNWTACQADPPQAIIQESTNPDADSSEPHPPDEKRHLNRLELTG